MILILGAVVFALNSGWICKNKLADLVHLRDEQSIRTYNAMKEKLAMLLLQEDNFWKQRIKVHWLKDGDMNTNFFHSMATMQRNEI